MKKNVDLTGRRFGRLIVLSLYGRDKYGNTTWKCKCECGNETIVVRRSLCNHNTQSCGCLHRELQSKRFLKDLTGQIFERLTVIKRHGKDGRGEALWLCKCECGNETIVLGSNLRTKHTRSCGCLGLEITDYSGKQFDRLTVVKLYEKKSGKDSRWLCKCKCGKEKVVKSQSLINKLTRSCGCLISEHAKTFVVDMEIGSKWGRCTILNREGSYIDIYGSCASWRVKCDCGNEFITTGHRLRSGITKSCGCYNKDQTRMAANQPEMKIKRSMNTTIRHLNQGHNLR
jgi:hypothetical protein